MLAKVTAVDVDVGASTSLSLFVRCHRVAASSSSSSRASGDTLQVELLDPPTLYEASVSGLHKPRALDCTGVQYVTSVEKAFSPQLMGLNTRFQFKWERQKMVLTLMETAEFAMKYTAVKFTRVEDTQVWKNMLHAVAGEEVETKEFLLKEKQKTQELEKLVQKKDGLLDSALKAKQAVENKLFGGFCAVLNAKKDEIQRLKNELVLAEAKVERMMEGRGAEVAVSAGKRRRPVAKRTRKAVGAKLKKKKEEDEDEEMSDVSDKHQSAGESSSDEKDQDMGTDEGQDRKRKRDAVKAYSQLPADLRRGSQKICSAEEMLSSLDALVNDEVDADEAEQHMDKKEDVKTEPQVSTSAARFSRSQSRSSAPSQSQADSSTTKVEDIKLELSSPAKSKQVKQYQPVSPAKSVDSEEEDILDMLS